MAQAIGILFVTVMTLIPRRARRPKANLLGEAMFEVSQELDGKKIN